MSKAIDFRSIVVSLWLRLICLGIVGVVFAEAIFLSRGKAQGWTFYLTTSAVIFEVVVRLISATLAGMALGTLCTVVIIPVLWYFKSSREVVATRATQIVVLLVVFFDSRLALLALIKAWASNHGPRFTTALLVAHFLTFVVVLCIPRARKEVVTSLDGFLGEKMTRRTAIATVAGAAALVVTEFALSKTVPTAKLAPDPTRPKPNILLITFDALSAEDMSLYGYRLPTTPNIDAFSSKATVFTNFYSGSTFTTPGLATILTGTYPSECHVYQIPGQVSRAMAEKSLPYAMRRAGYATGALISSPVAFFFAKTFVSGFDVIPEPAFYKGGPQYLWDSTEPLHQNSGIGSRYDEHVDVGHAWYYPGQPPIGVSMRVRPDTTFEQAKQVLAKLPDGFFLWIHVVTPHDPYLPDAADRGRFIPDAELRSFEEESGEKWTPHYEPSKQGQIDRRRLGYDEFVATADRAFGSFMSDLETSGRLHDTTVIVSADHGESFEGGVYQHRSAYQTRPVIHIPLVIRSPGQQDGRKVGFTADQTTLAPTILELAGQPKPDWMKSQSLASWLDRDGQGEGEGRAFCQYLEQSSIFRPLRRGTVGVIDGQFQYVLDLDTHKGSLRPLNEAQIWNLDHSSENPARAAALRAEIHTRFPELQQNPT